MVPVVTYSLLRLGLFAAALLGLWLAGMGGWLLVVVATVAAWALSYVVLRRYQLRADRWIAERRASGRPRFSADVEADAAAEDAAAEDAAAEDVAPEDTAADTDADAAAEDADADQSASPRPSSTP
jgi:hypothetical protein